MVAFHFICFKSNVVTAHTIIKNSGIKVVEINLIDYQDSDISSLWNDYAETRNKGLKNF